MMMLANIAFHGVLAIAVIADLNGVMVNIHNLNRVFGICAMRMGER